MQLINRGDHLLHCCTQLTRWLLGEVSYTHGAIHLAAELLMFNTNVASSSIKVAFEKKSSKHIHMGSSFEELVARNPAVKTVLRSDTRFKSCSFLKI